MRLTTLAPLLMLMLPPTAALTSTSCLGCTLIGYSNGLSVQVGVPPGPAAYRIEVEADGDDLSLRYQVMPGFAPQCVGECQVEGARIALSSGFFSPDAQHLSALVSDLGRTRGPSKATLRIYRDDVLALECIVEPHYKTAEPNGSGCGEQVFASISLDVP